MPRRAAAHSMSTLTLQGSPRPGLSARATRAHVARCQHPPGRHRRPSPGHSFQLRSHAEDQHLHPEEVWGASATREGHRGQALGGRPWPEGRQRKVLYSAAIQTVWRSQRARAGQRPPTHAPAPTPSREGAAFAQNATQPPEEGCQPRAAGGATALSSTVSPELSETGILCSFGFMFTS